MNDLAVKIGRSRFVPSAGNQSRGSRHTKQVGMFQMGSQPPIKLRFNDFDIVVGKKQEIPATALYPTVVAFGKPGRVGYANHFKCRIGKCALITGFNNRIPYIIAAANNDRNHKKVDKWRT